MNLLYQPPPRPPTTDPSVPGAVAPTKWSSGPWPPIFQNSPGPVAAPPLFPCAPPNGADTGGGISPPHLLVLANRELTA